MLGLTILYTVLLGADNPDTQASAMVSAVLVYGCGAALILAEAMIMAVTLLGLATANPQAYEKLQDLGKLRGPGRAPQANGSEAPRFLLTQANGLQSRYFAPISRPSLGKPGDPATKYLWTIDFRGLNVASERADRLQGLSPDFLALEKVIHHQNISTEAFISGEAWFVDEQTVAINVRSRSWGSGIGGSIQQNYDAAIKYWETLKYKVIAEPIGNQ
jgi:hypothetical protein